MNDRLWKECQEFHGHACGGLAIGFRAAETAAELLGFDLERAEDEELVNLCLTAIQAAITEGLTGDKAWVYARDKLVAALKSTGRDLGDCLIDTALQCVYDAWKNGNLKPVK